MCLRTVDHSDKAGLKLGSVASHKRSYSPEGNQPTTCTMKWFRYKYLTSLDDLLAIWKKQHSLDVLWVTHQCSPDILRMVSLQAPCCRHQSTPISKSWPRIARGGSFQSEEVSCWQALTPDWQSAGGRGSRFALFVLTLCYRTSCTTSERKEKRNREGVFYWPP